MKYVAIVRSPCPFHSASEQAKNWDETHEVRIYVEGQRVWVKHVESQNRGGWCGGATGTAWKEINFCSTLFRISNGKPADYYINNFSNIRKENFKGKPRVK